ncbi:uncharacterized protein BDR25DRAFT_376118 [Lindgomyces ingoldianus]|uniref:Uncharacterized protein n=1 Tax=Lindgomyces ingoldianus TaxID=673940 RepID=A0ACB6QJR1_9PLEO|nr:uncharacterized protein BDR25DRAFT_376118 [Lindgomyces ingoldianus]KAF2467233.1 hypothetical protein BDR25DRAFT_376118 [Lindgomyces ingoldianus]
MEGLDLLLPNYLKRKRVAESIEKPDEERPRKVRPPLEILVLGNNDCDSWEIRKGRGSKKDPLTFSHWRSSDINTINAGNNDLVVISDSDVEGNDRPLQDNTAQRPRGGSEPHAEPEAFASEFWSHYRDQNIKPKICANALRNVRSEEMQDDDHDDCISILDDCGKYPPSRPQRKPSVITIKEKVGEEPKELTPGLSSSQQNEVSENLDTGHSSQDFDKIPLDTTLKGAQIESLEPGFTFLGERRFKSTSPRDQDVQQLPQKVSARNAQPRTPEQDAILKEKKRLFYHTYWKQYIPLIKRKLSAHHQRVLGSRRFYECWLYSGRLPKKSRAISVSIRFQHDGDIYNITVNIMFVAMLLEGIMTDKHKEGIIENKWQASHLCSNWTCLNPYHVIPEPGVINNSRKQCYKPDSVACSHIPQCLKHLKVDEASLLPTERP